MVAVSGIGVLVFICAQLAAASGEVFDTWLLLSTKRRSAVVVVACRFILPERYTLLEKCNVNVDTAAPLVDCRVVLLGGWC